MIPHLSEKGYILDAIATIERYASQGRQAFDNQELIQIWIVHHLQIIGEATNALSSELTPPIFIRAAGRK